MHVASYRDWQLFPYKQEDTLRAVGDQPLRPAALRIFFKTYTEKVWGIPCSELKAEWAAQRIKDLSLQTAVLSMFVKPRTDDQDPDRGVRLSAAGPGMMWNAVQATGRRPAAATVQHRTADVCPCSATAAGSPQS